MAGTARHILACALAGAAAVLGGTMISRPPFLLLPSPGSFLFAFELEAVYLFSSLPPTPSRHEAAEGCFPPTLWCDGTVLSPSPSSLEAMVCSAPHTGARGGRVHFAQEKGGR